jgi:hypothetical protein
MTEGRSSFNKLYMTKLMDIHFGRNIKVPRMGERVGGSHLRKFMIVPWIVASYVKLLRPLLFSAQAGKIPPGRHLATLVMPPNMACVFFIHAMLERNTYLKYCVAHVMYCVSPSVALSFVTRSLSPPPTDQIR